MTVTDAGAEPRLPLVLILLAITSSIVVATEFIVIGLLPVLAHDLGVSVADAGWLIGAFALSAAVLGPPLTLFAAAHSPRSVMVVTLLLFAASNAVAAWTSQYTVILVIRALQGAALPVFISVGTAAVSGLATEEHRGRTLAKANWGFVIGVIGALPISVALSESGHWVLPLLVLSALAFVASILVAAVFPTADINLPNFGDQIGLLTRPGFLAHLALTVAAFAATFSVYSYFTVWLNAVVGMDMHKVAITLFGFGAAGFFGNLVASRIADRIPIAGTLAAVSAVAAAAAGAATYHRDMIILAPLLALWGAAHIAVVTLCQVRVITAGGRAPAFAMSMNISAANLGIAAGALIGGSVINRAGLDAIAVAPIGLTMLVAMTAALVPLAARVCRCST